MRDIWIKISYYWFLFMLFIVGLLCGGLNVKASTNVSVSDKSFYVRWEDETTGEKEWSIRSNMGTSISYPSSHPYINALSARFISNSAYFTKGIKYRVVVDVRYGNGNNKNVMYPVSSLLCSGSTSTSWSTNEELIDSCQYISREYLSESNKMRYQFDIVTNTDVRGIKVNFYFDMRKVGLWNIGNVNILTSSFVSYDTSTQQAIESQTTTIINNNNENTEKIIDSITDDSVDNPNSSIEDMQDMLPSNGTITQLIALPITLYQKVLNSINGTCQSFNLGSLYNTNLIIPCIDISNYLGSTIWNSIDLIISGVFVLVIARKMIKAFEGFTSMKEGDVIND